MVGKRLQGILVVGLIIALTATVNAGTYYSLYGSGDTVNTAAIYQLTNKVMIGASTNPNNQLEITGGSGNAQGLRVNTTGNAQYRARTSTHTDRELRFEISSDGNAYFGTSGLSGTIASHLTLRTTQDAGANTGEVRIKPGNSEAINATKDAQVAVGSTTASAAFGSMDRLVVNGPIRLSDSGTQPTCSATYRGMIWHEFGGAGVKDSVQVCAKDAGDAYAFRTIY